MRRASLPTRQQSINDAGIGERRGVAETRRRAFGNLAQDAAHDLARTGLGQRGGEVDLLGGGKRANFLADLGVELFAQRVVAVFAGVERDVGVDRLALDVVRV